ncbi:SixA phosphatase family protein [Campylobacter mucosalis]|uniref:SixA phosphatase family protein n=1 Tax=Campylobacter mucosalis TaxID=202 RepID=UPI0014705652|nr:histidine phosphatase family protein [Campylobacter mucosalis]
MKRIYFMRHAKAESQSDNKKDFTRELNSRGKEDIELMAKVLKGLNVKIDAVFCSEATRCEHSAKRLISELNLKKKPKSVASFYNASYAKLLKFISGIDDKFNDVLIIAHNPAITEICEHLSDSAIGNIPTSGVFAIEFECEFANIKEGEGRALFFEYPKKYKKSSK